MPLPKDVLRLGFVVLGGVALASCATRPPVVSGSPNYSVVSADVTGGDAALAGALDSRLDTGFGAGRAAFAEIEITETRYGAGFLGFFRGGANYAVLSTSLIEQSSGRKIGAFSFTVADGGDEDSAAARLAAKAADYVSAWAANAPVKASSVPVSAPTQVTATPGEPEPEIISAPTTIPVSGAASEPLPPAPVFSPVVPPAPVPAADPAPAGGDDLCVIGPDGKCIEL